MFAQPTAFPIPDTFLMFVLAHMIGKRREEVRGIERKGICGRQSNALHPLKVSTSLFSVAMNCYFAQ